jgi:signal transduction histidine kinase
LRRLRPDIRVLIGVVVLMGAIAVSAFTWYVTVEQVRAQRLATSDRITVSVTNQATIFADGLGRQLLAVEQTLRAMTDSWEADARRFDLRGMRARAPVLEGISRDALLVDENGMIRQATIPEAVGQFVANADYFRDAIAHAGERDRLFVGPATLDGIMRLWHFNVARSLRYPDGSFAGVIVMDYRVSAVTDLFLQNTVGVSGLVELVGMGDGKIRAAVGPPTVDPDAIISDSQMFAVLQRESAGIWVGPSSPDSVLRIHAFRRLPNRELALVVGVEEQEAMRPATEWKFDAYVYASLVSLLSLAVVVTVLHAVRSARRREVRFAEDRAVLAAANAQLEVARARADAKTDQLEVTLAGMTDGVAMVDAHLCLVEWNTRFADVAGIPVDTLRVGLPMEDIIRAQAADGQFGPVNVEAEVQRRMEALRTGHFGITQRKRPDGRTIELRRNRLPDGGFVTLYADITDHKQAEAALRQAREIADQANADKSRFMAIVSHEIRTPLNALLNTMQLLTDSQLQASQRSLVAMASQAGQALTALINDILDLSRAEAGQLALRPNRFALRPMLQSAAEAFTVPAGKRGIWFRVEVGGDVPAELVFDPARLRQVVMNLLSNAVKFTDPGEVLIVAQTTEGAFAGARRLTISVRDRGPAIPEAERGRLFRPFSQLGRARDDGMSGSGLGLAICRQLVELMEGGIACEAWTAPDGRTGNDFQISLPLSDVTQAFSPAPAEPARFAAPADDEMRILPRVPRTRILLVEDVRANQIITATMLRRAGHWVDAVSSGEAAIEAVGQVPYDIVLMDINLPGLSGQDTTRHIRAILGPAAALPIVALTGDVTEADEESFRAAGMNGVLVKPITLSELQDTFSRHIWHVWEIEAAPGAVAPEPEPVTHAEPVQAWLDNDRIAELRGNLAPETLTQLVEECLLDLDRRLPALRRALNTEAAGSVAIHAHAMVGMAAGYGMLQLANRLRQVMIAARAGDVKGLADWIPQIEQDLAGSAVALREAVGLPAIPAENIPA